MPRALRVLLLAAVIGLFLIGKDSRALPRGPVARGLALYAHAAASAAPGAKVAVAIEAYGFPSVTQAVALPGATIVLGWSPDSLGPKVEVPPPVTATTDALGHAVLDVPVPEGDDRELELLIALHYEEHERTTTAKVKREKARSLALFVADAEVVPGGNILAWARTSATGSGRSLPGARVKFQLLEGGVPRVEREVTSDASGLARFETTVPRVDESSWSWTLAASTEGAGAASSEIRLASDTPRAATLFVTVDTPVVSVGRSSPFAIYVRDAAGKPVAKANVTYHVSPSTQPGPADPDAWKKIAKSATTDAEGKITGTVNAPLIVAPGANVSMVVEARATLEGREVRANGSMSVGREAEDVHVVAEAGDLLPGVPQQLFVTATLGGGRPAPEAILELKGDGLSTRVTTDARGEAHFTWSPPLDVGASRNVGPCAGGIAAQITARPITTGVFHTPLFESCVSVDREVGGLVQVTPLVAKVGERVHVKVVTPNATNKGVPWSVLVEAADGTSARALWLKDGEGDFSLEGERTGVFSLSAVSPREKKGTRLAGASFLVLPRVRPRLEVKPVTGSARPNGTAEVDVVLRDSAGKPLAGSVAVAMGDVGAGANLANVESLDYRRSHCLVDRERCETFLEGGQGADALRREAFATRRPSVRGPLFDPKSKADSDLRATFADTLKSLEGAVYEASNSREALRDVRRKEGARYTWNPELLTLTTASMEHPPQTPGGEDFALNDLIAVDSQVSFDVVARRVARLKLFHVIVAVRAAMKGIDRDEPMFKNPQAILRKVIRDGALEESALLDPWGGTIQFFPSNVPPEPFLGLVRGFEIRSPGPDGIGGNGDDVRDPFGRVVRSGTPYAEALHEDRIVDAKFEMEVADATVDSWLQLLETETGMALGGRGEGASLGIGGGIGTGHGIGQGAGGRLGGVGYVSKNRWLEPVKTDSEGRARLRVPLGSQETTWRLALVGLAADAPPVVEMLDIPTSLPLSAHVETPDVWTMGDSVTAHLSIRNRTKSRVRAKLTIEARGAVELASRTLPREVVVEPFATTDVSVPTFARTRGEGALAVAIEGADGLADTLVHHFRVRAAAEPYEATSGAVVAEDEALAFVAERGVALRGTPRLVLSRGYEGHLRATLSAVDPDTLKTRESLADAIEIGERVARWAAIRGDRETAARAEDVRRRAVSRFYAKESTKDAKNGWIAEMRARAHAPVDLAPYLRGADGCPLAGERDVAGLEAEPPVFFARADVAETKTERAVARPRLPCWDTFATERAGDLRDSNDAVSLARAVLAFADRPPRSPFVAPLASRLATLVKLSPDGSSSWRDEAKVPDRALVYAALLRTARIGISVAPPEAIAARIVADRDHTGGYGTSSATRAVAIALAESDLVSTAPSRVKVVAAGVTTFVDLPPSGEAYVPLPARTIEARVHVSGPPVIARFERPVERSWASPPPDSGAVQAEVRWPTVVTVGTIRTVDVMLRARSYGPSRMVVRLPLPPGSSLAAPIQGVTQAGGIVSIVRDTSGEAVVLQLPVRFDALVDAMVPEGKASLVGDESAATVIPARRIATRAPTPN